MSEKKKYALFKVNCEIDGSVPFYVLAENFADAESAASGLTQFGPVESIEKVCEGSSFAIAPRYLEQFLRKGEKPNE